MRGHLHNFHTPAIAPVRTPHTRGSQVARNQRSHRVLSTAPYLAPGRLLPHYIPRNASQLASRVTQNTILRNGQNSRVQLSFFLFDLASLGWVISLFRAFLAAGLVVMALASISYLLA